MALSESSLPNSLSPTFEGHVEHMMKLSSVKVSVLLPPLKTPIQSKNKLLLTNKSIFSMNLKKILI